MPLPQRAIRVRRGGEAVSEALNWLAGALFCVSAFFLGVHFGSKWTREHHMPPPCDCQEQPIGYAPRGGGVK